jgi:hypothetical protein
MVEADRAAGRGHVPMPFEAARVGGQPVGVEAGIVVGEHQHVACRGAGASMPRVVQSQTRLRYVARPFFRGPIEDLDLWA